LSKTRILWLGSALLLVAALGLGGYAYLSGDSWLIARIQQQANRDFHAQLEAVQAHPEHYLHPPAEEPMGLIALITDRQGQVLSWSSSRLVPPQRSLRQFVRAGQAGLLRQGTHYLYCLPILRGDSAWVFLFPLYLGSPIHNEYLQSHAYLGGAHSATLDQAARTWPIRQVPGPMQLAYYSPQGQYLFGLQVTDTEPLRRQPMGLAALLLLLSCLLAVYAGYMRLRRRLHGALADAILILTLVGLRLLLFPLHLPGSLIQTGLFSSQVLAVNQLNPSLGDLSLNSLLGFLLVYRLYVRLPHQQLARWLQRRAPASWWLWNVFSFTLGFGLFQAFFYWFARIVNNSKIYFEFSDLSRLDAYSYLVFLNIALFLLSIFLLQYLLAGVTLQLRPRPGRPYSRSALLLLFGFLLAGLYLLYLPSDLPLLVVFAAYVLAIHLFRAQVGARLRFSLVQAATLFGLFAVVTNFAVSRSLEANRVGTLQYYAKIRYSRVQDPFTDFYFGEVIANIRADASLWQPDTTIDATGNPYQDAINRILHNHLVNNIKGYDFRVFLFNAYKRRLDTQADLTPYPVWRNQRLMQQAPGQNGHLLTVPYNRSFTREIYIGRFDVYPSDPNFGRITLQIELYPKRIIRDKLYPQLMQDASLKNKLNVPYGFEIGLYSNGRLVQQVENTLGQRGQSFPVRFEARYGGIRQDTLLYGDARFYELVSFHDKNRIIVARAPRRTFFNQLTAVSFLFYFFLLLYLLVRLPAMASRVRQGWLGRVRHSFVARIEFFLVLISLVPLVIFWLLTTNVLNRYFQQEIDEDLQHALQQAGAVLEDSEGLTALLRQPANEESPQSRSELNLLSNLLGSDLNVYDQAGYLRATTRPRLYQASLSSPYMNPDALKTLSAGQAPSTLVKERIGNLSFLSGYIPLYNDRFEPQGYLNIPYLAQQDALDFQIEKFLAYLINVYVFIIMILVLVGIFMSRSLTHPLMMLRQRLEQTSLGLANEPIPWDSRDEIGRIIQSYNQMLEKLAESEQKLSQSQRNQAWTEMARQVAHEIKNPLTPMKLSLQHLARAADAEPEKQRAMLQKVTQTLLTQIESLTAIANSFKDYARMPAYNPQPVLLGKLLSEVHGLYEGTEQVDIRLRLPAQEVYILGDANQLNRVLVNLVRNALQAIDRPDGWLEIRLYTEAGLAIVEVADNGSGIPEEIRARIFEPNFSTKSSGMGLGLALARRMVESMGGQIDFSSETGAGTTFVLRFPLHAPPA
jgi:two-component system nitrogen regulation sensor histidine kinase NtrY